MEWRVAQHNIRNSKDYQLNRHVWPLKKHHTYIIFSQHWYQKKNPKKYTLLLNTELENHLLKTVESLFWKSLSL